MDPDVFVRASATPGELGGGDGTEAHPFESVKAGIEALNATGGIVGLFGGTHFIESVSLEDIHGQDKEHPIIVEPVKDSGEVFIDSCLPQFVEPNGGWVALHPPDGVEGEYIWPERFDHPTVVRHGAFFDRPKHTRLVSNDMVQDLRSTGQIWPRDAGENKVFVLDTRPGPTQGFYVPQFVANRPTRRPWVYMGPGIWFDESAEADEKDPSGVVVNYGGRHVHIRMEPTTNHISDEWPDYEGESNPNNLPLALSQELNYALFLRTCSHLTFKNLTLRFGSPDTVRLNNCLDIVFDHCRIRSASRAIFLTVDDKKPDHENRDIVVGDCEIDGGIPTWFFRSDRKDNYRFGPDSATQLTEEETTENRIGFSTSGVQISGGARSFNVEVHHCEIVNAHDSYIFGDGMKFHHNWVNNLNDDGIAVSFDGGTKNAHIYSNVMTQCLTALSFAAKRVGMVKIYANLFDIREPTLGVRPPTHVGVPDALRQGHFFKDGADEGEIELFHNTCVVRDPGAKGDDFGDANDAGFSYYSTIGQGMFPRRAFNNIFVAAYTPGAVRPIAFLAPKSFACETNGNTFFRVPEGDGLNNFLVRRRKALTEDLNEENPFADLHAYHENYWPGGDVNEYERDSLLHDPEFRSFDTATGDRHPGDDLRLQPRPDDFDPATQPWRVAVTMPDSLGELYEEATSTPSEDRGCYPSNGARLAVGVNSRKKFPRPRRPHIGPETHPPIDEPPVVDGRH